MHPIEFALGLDVEPTRILGFFSLLPLKHLGLNGPKRIKVGVK